MQIAEISESARAIRENIERVIVGKSEEINLVLAALFAGGHVLLEDVPGTGKTMLAKALAKSIDCEFARVQFTPDLLPSDLTGLNVYSPKTGDFSFRRGALFTNILLADEINRATPRTQSGLLESMEERQITIDGETHPLPPPYFVIATQNPIETQGTFPLPEAQLDRFLIRLSLGYPSLEETVDIFKRNAKELPIEEIQPVCNADTLLGIQKAVKDVFMHEDLLLYLARLTQETRQHPAIALGISTRGSMALMGVARAYAAIQGRSYALPDDIQLLLPYTFSHRILCRAGAGNDESVKELLKEIVHSVDVPVEDWG